MNPRYPVYVISKGRWESRLTVKHLEEMHVPYRVVIEPQEHEQYASVIPENRLLVLPFSNLGRGSIPARNWVWEHSVSEGHIRHWILDDNINGFFRLAWNLKTPVHTGAVFCAMEDFTDRYENVALSGPNYFMFVSSKEKYPPFYLNTRVYSCILIHNHLPQLLTLEDPEYTDRIWPPDGRPQLWRGRYNEDTDLSLRTLKAGFCTVLFNAFLAWKMNTMLMKGGNTDELYVGDRYGDNEGRKAMAKELQAKHPDVTRVTRKWGRWQHHVDYSPFAGNKLKLRSDMEIPQEPNEYGMVLRTGDVKVPRDQWRVVPREEWVQVLRS